MSHQFIFAISQSGTEFGGTTPIEETAQKHHPHPLSSVQIFPHAVQARSRSIVCYLIGAAGVGACFLRDVKSTY